MFLSSLLAVVLCHVFVSAKPYDYCAYDTSFCGDVFLNRNDANVLIALAKVMENPPSDWKISKTCASGWTGVCTNKNGRVTELTSTYPSFISSLPRNFGNLSKLQYLDFSGNFAIHELPPSFGSLSEMTRLDLALNRLNRIEDLSMIGKLKKLRFLDLSYNYFSADIAPLSNLRSLVTLDFSSNGISGHIPLSFGTFKNLLFLNLQFNKLCGTIPSNLAQLEYLNFYSNYLTGSVPRKLQEKYCNTSSYLFEQNCFKSSRLCNYKSNAATYCTNGCNPIPNRGNDVAHHPAFVEQSSTYRLAGAYNVVDGSAGYGKLSSESCSQTLTQRNPNLFVHFYGPYEVTTVQLYNRLDACCGKWLNGVQVYVGNSGENYAKNRKCKDPKYTYGPKSRGFPVNVTCNIEGEVVWVVIPGEGKILSLCEVAVFAK